MTFINPLELLSLENMSISSLNNEIIKRNKKLVLAEIEFSDDKIIEYYGRKISKPEVERAFAELEEKEKVEIYHIIANTKQLNSFLASGDNSIFMSFKQESFYKWSSFVHVVSDYFAESYDKNVYNSYKKNDFQMFQKIINVTPIVNSNDLENCYLSICRLISKKCRGN